MALARAGLPLVLNGGWAAAILIGIPVATGTSLRWLGYLFPDVITTLTASAGVALFWGFARIPLVLAALHYPGMPLFARFLGRAPASTRP
jgi:hypothetical protein